MYQEIIDALNDAENNSQISICCITGNGEFFSSGNDVTNYLRSKNNESQEKLIEDGVNLYGYIIILQKINFKNNNHEINIRKYVESFIKFKKPLIGTIFKLLLK